MDLRWDWTIRGINSAKILSKTASGKSCNIEIQSYDNEPQVFTGKTHDYLNKLLDARIKYAEDKGI